MKISKFIFTASFCLFADLVNAQQVEWRVVHREDGCISFKDVDDSGLGLEKVKTPDEFLRVLKKTYPDAKMQVFLDAISDPENRPKTEEGVQRFKLITRKNAYMISFDRGNNQIPVWTKDLCDQMMKFRSEEISK
ncbi:hypothetical protein H8K35_11905 [Undibacterium sp. LX40W]|uniref:Uncharacterized protein n=1 Tax=Undibacterium nitidum TaxID=2762298 RepID=A0A923HPC3_9BURK|nr:MULTISPECIES: hypothetical protein [Undibacterium]MBC3882088.1 hypothetical protein [Undibacterium nitidum]MBC3892369.1 hypothetical protein [Undibacterium sp. LX40W]